MLTEAIDTEGCTLTEYARDIRQAFKMIKNRHHKNVSVDRKRKKRVEKGINTETSDNLGGIGTSEECKTIF